MRRIILYFIATIFIWVVLSQCVIMRNRWSDKKAVRIFSRKKVSLSIHDTIIKNRHLHFAISGSDSLPTLVFIHGSPGSWMNYAKYMWDSTLLRKFRMVSIDRPGFGFSDFGSPLHVQQKCVLILPVLQSLKNKKSFYLYGHSMGGAIVTQLAATDPRLFDAMVIAAGSIDYNQEKKETWRKIMNAKPLYWLLPGAFGPSNTELLYLKSDLLPLQQEFKKITCKVHFIHGDEDKWVPIANVDYGKKMMINASLLTSDTIKGAGHHIPWKNKDRITELLLRLY